MFIQMDVLCKIMHFLKSLIIQPVLKANSLVHSN